MAKSRKDEMIAFESPLDNEFLTQFGNEKSVTNALNDMLNTFQTGMEQAGYGSSLRTLYKNSPILVGWATPLKAAGLFGEETSDPSVETVLKVGKHVKIVKPDGEITDFTTEFFNNPTVRSMIEKEKGLSKREKRYGNVLLAYMGAFLNAKKDPRLKNTSKGYKGMHPAEGNGYGVYIEMPDKTRQVVTDPETKQKRDEIIGKVENAEKTMLSFPEEPTVPAPPRERNVFRRFFSWIGLAKHSQEYNDSKAAYDKAVQDRSTYLNAKKEIEDALNESAGDPLMKKAMEQQSKVESAFTANAADISRIRTKLTDVRTLKNIVNSKAEVFTKGSVGATLDIIRNRPLVRQHIQNGELPKKDVEAINEFSKYHHVEDGGIDDTPITDINRLITLVSPLHAGVYAFKAEKMAKETGTTEYRNEEFNAAAKKEYEEMVKDSRKAFEDNFGIEANPKNVQAVADAFELDKYVKYGVVNIDGEEYGPEDKLPRVDETNVGDMTFLLMSGIKTVAVMGNLIPDAKKQQPEKQPVVHDYPELAPAEEAGPAPKTL